MCEVEPLVNQKRKNNYELSIVVPIFNAEHYIRAKFDSLVGIDDIDYEIIFAVNRGTDRSEQLVNALAERRQNIKIVSQQEFVSAGQNFQAGVKEASGRFIYVSAVDDICDKEFYKEAIAIFEKNETASAVAPKSLFRTRPNKWELIEFELLGSQENRIRSLIKNIRISHGVFYSMTRKEVAHNLYSTFNEDFDFIAGDWFIELKLALKGEVFRTKSRCSFGMSGMSRSRNALWKEGDSILKKCFPYRHLVLKILVLSTQQNTKVKLLLWGFCLKLIRANLHRLIFHIINSHLRFMKIRNL
jgi:glycosyltransferase involved in cell wall biosynthesis